MQKILLLTMVAVSIVFTSCCFLSRSEYGMKSMEKIKKSVNFVNGRFLNTERTKVLPGGYFEAIKKMLKSENTVPEKRYSFSQKNIIDSFNDNDRLQAAWLGHSTVLLKIEDKFVLTDPVWGKRVSPVPFLGPERFFTPPFEVEDLPPLDAVIISHDHYDHLDRHTVKKLANVNVKNFFVPLGVGKYLVKWGIDPEKVKEFDWWDSFKIDDNFSITAAPSKHFSGRGLFDRNSTLWASWIIKGSNHSVFFSGDSGYSGDFKKIGKKFGPFDLVLMESGAYDELWKEIHMGPENAVKAFKDLNGKVLMPVHWGTFKLANHPWNEPAEQIVKLSKGAFPVILPEPGKTISINSKNVVSAWWKETEQKDVKNEVAYSYR